MKKLLTASALPLLLSATLHAQPIVNSWLLNTSGKLASQWFNNGGMPATWTFTNMTDSADALRVCYNADTVWVRSQGLTDNMGKWLNPGGAIAQNYVHRFPRNPTVPTAKTTVPMGGGIGLLLNGIPIFGLSNANSWTGSTNAGGMAGGLGIWNVEVGKSEGAVLDTAFGAHPQMSGAYHTHTTPYRFYKNKATTKHSPIVGYAFDGYPIYGPYGYGSPTDSTSGITRMRSGYSLRNITTRTTLPDGTTATQAGPPVNTTYPIGTYCEDWEWLASNSGTLDKYNGRFCVTPEYPAGTYAYFVTIDAAGNAAFPYYLGFQYYGKPDVANFPTNPTTGNGLKVPANVTCLGNVTGVDNTVLASRELVLYPNPSSGEVVLLGNGHGYNNVTVFNSLGQKVYSAVISGNNNHTINLAVAGIYFVRCGDTVSGRSEVKRLVVE